MDKVIANALQAATASGASRILWMAGFAAALWGAVTTASADPMPTMGEVLAAINGNATRDACRLVKDYEEYSGGYAITVRPDLERLSAGQSASTWYQKASAAAAGGDHAQACVDYFRAMAAEKMLFAGSQYDQKTFDGLRDLGMKEYDAAYPAFKLPVAPPDSADAMTPPVVYVLQHPTPAGTPPACRTAWGKSGPLSQACADALFAQAEIERKSGNCAAAMTDYGNAREAAQNAGTIVQMKLKQLDGRTACHDQ